MTNLLQSLIEQDYGYEGNSEKWGRSSEHDSLVLNKEKNLWFWNSRGLHGDAVDYLVKIRGMSKKDAEEIVKSSISIVNPVLKNRNITETPYEKLVDFLWMNGKNHRDYWYRRLLNDETIDRYRLGFHDGWSTIPLYEDGTFLNFQIRRDEPDKRIKYWYHIKNFKPVMINSEILNFVDSVYITEGTVDSILLNQLGYPSVAQTGGSGYWSPEWYFLFRNIKEIVYIRDNDEPGIHHAKLVANSLGTERVKIAVLGDREKYDTVDFFRDNRTKEELEEICKTKFKYSFQLGKGAKK